MVWPAASRPYIGGSQHNSILELTLGYNGFGRLDGSETGSVGGGNTTGGQWGSTGLFRMFGSEVGTQVGLAASRPPWSSAAPDSGSPAAAARWRSAPGSRCGSAGCWSPALTFSFMAGIFHPYYTVALAPAIGALVGIGASVLWRHRDSLAATGRARAHHRPDRRARPSSSSPGTRRGTRGCGTLVARGRLRRRALIVGVQPPAARASPRRSRPPRSSPGWPAPRRTPSRRRPPRTRARSRAPGRRRAGSAAVAAASGGCPRPGQRGAAPGGTTGGTRAAHRRRQHRRPARRQHLERGPDHPARGRRVVVHLGGRGDRLQQRGRLPARDAAAGDGDRRVQRLRPEPDAGAVRAVGRRGQDPLLHRPGQRRVRRRRISAGGSTSSQISTWVEDTFTAKTVDGVTVYDLTTG